jgi:hypothetical protein
MHTDHPFPPKRVGFFKLKDWKALKLGFLWRKTQFYFYVGPQDENGFVACVAREFDMLHWSPHPGCSKELFSVPKSG